MSQIKIKIAERFIYFRIWLKDFWNHTILRKPRITDPLKEIANLVKYVAILGAASAIIKTIDEATEEQDKK